MTVENTNSTISYTGNGSVTVFAYDFLSYSEDHLFIYLDDVVQTTGFSISGIGEDAGGNITFDVAPLNGVDVRIDRTVPVTQEIEYQEYGPFPAKTNERGLDLGVMIDQQIDRDVVRNASAKMDKQPTATTNNIVVFDSTGNSKDSGFAIDDIDGFTPVEQARQAGDNAQTQFDTPSDVASSPFEFQVRLDGLRMRGVTDYSTSTIGKIDFTVAPTNLAEIDITWYKPLIGADAVIMQEVVDSNKKYDQSVTLAEAVADTKAKAGDDVIISDRGYGRFTYLESQTPNTWDIVQCVGVPTLALVLRLPNSNPIAWGVVGDGVADDKAAWENIFNTSKANMVTNDDDIYLISTKSTITSVDNITLSGKGTFKSTDINGIFDFSSCDNLTITDVNWEGDQDLASWTALTTGERQQHRALVTVTSSDKPRVTNFNSSKKSAGLKYHVCTNTSTINFNHLGPLGPTSAGLAIDANFAYGFFINGGSAHHIYNPVGKETGGVVLVGLSAPDVKSYGGNASNSHDNGWYGSSVEGAVVDGFTQRDGLSNCVKHRGSNNIIQNCFGFDTPNIQFVLSGVPLDTNVDSQGAVGHGGGIYNCEAKNCNSLLRVDRVKETVDWLYMRDVEVRGNKGFELTDAVTSPIEVYGVKNLTVKDNTINGFLSDASMTLLGDAALLELTNSTVEGNHIENGARLFSLQNVNKSRVANNTYTSLTEVIVSIMVNVDGIEFLGNHGDDPAKRIDVRTHTNSVALNNDMFIQGNNNVQGESRSQGNATNPNYDVSVLIPTRIGHIVSNGSAMFIAKATAATTDWVAL